MMIFKQHASSSQGNLYEIQSQGRRLMVESGLAWKLTQAYLNFDLSNIDGWLVSHEHADHSKCSIEVVKAGINLYASEGTLEAIKLNGHRNTQILTSEVITHFGEWSVYPFKAKHDCEEPQCFVIINGGEQILFAVDIYNIKQKFTNKFNIIAIECSYDKDILSERVKSGEANETYAKRLLTSHMEKQACFKYLKKCDLSNCREIHLLHMSKANINKEETVKELEKEFMIKVVAI